VSSQILWCRRMLPSHHIWLGESLIRQAVSNGTLTTHSVTVEKSRLR